MPRAKKATKKKRIPLTQVVKGTEQFSDPELKEMTRVYLPTAIQRLADLCNSNNDGVALGAIKVMLAKNLPDLKATDLTTGGDKIKLDIDVDGLLERAYGDNKDSITS